jgi:hypothetical protein
MMVVYGQDLGRRALVTTIPSRNGQEPETGVVAILRKPTAEIDVAGEEIKALILKTKREERNAGDVGTEAETRIAGQERAVPSLTETDVIEDVQEITWKEVVICRTTKKVSRMLFWFDLASVIEQVCYRHRR